MYNKIRSIRSQRRSFSWPKSWAVCSFLIELALVYLSGGENRPQSWILQLDSEMCTSLAPFNTELKCLQNRTLAQVYIRKHSYFPSGSSPLTTSWLNLNISFSLPYSNFQWRQPNLHQLIREDEAHIMLPAMRVQRSKLSYRCCRRT